MTEHIDEFAELYALGSLEDLERARVERHVASCETCAIRLKNAEETVAEMAHPESLQEPPAQLQARLERSIGTRARASLRPFLPFGAAVAAVLILTLIPTWVAVDRSRSSTQAMRQDSAAWARIASAPFNHAQFVTPRNHPVNAKVIYGMRGDWYYVVVMHPKPGMRVAYVHGGRMQMLGTVAMHGEMGTLYLPIDHKMNELALLEGPTVVADAHLAY